MARDKNSGFFYLDENGVPREFIDEDTGKVLKASIGSLSRIGNAMPEITPEELVERAISRVISKHTGPPRKHFALGFTAGDFVKAVGLLVALIASYFAMRYTIEDTAEKTKQNGARTHQIAADVHDHKKADHKELDARVGKIERAVDRVEVKQDTAVELMHEIKGELREQRRRRRASGN